MVDLLFSNLLPQIDLAFQSLRRESGHIKTVVVKGGVEEFEAVIVEELGDFVTDQATLLKAANVGLEDQGLVAATHIQAGDVKSDTPTGSCPAAGRACT